MPLNHDLVPYGFGRYGVLCNPFDTSRFDLDPLDDFHPMSRPFAILNETMRDMQKELARIDEYMRHHGMFRDYWGNKSWPSVDFRIEDGEYRAKIPIGFDTDPKDLSITLKDHLMKVEAKKSTVSMDGKSRFYHEFTRSFNLPTTVDINDVQSVLAPGGFLHIRATLSNQETPSLGLDRKVKFREDVERAPLFRV